MFRIDPNCFVVACCSRLAALLQQINIAKRRMRIRKIGLGFDGVLQKRYRTLQLSFFAKQRSQQIMRVDTRCVDLKRATIMLFGLRYVACTLAAIASL